MIFKGIPGQEETKRFLLQTVREKRISHAQLFLGPEGCGKLALAIAYAQYIFCENKGEVDSCGLCLSCIKCSKLIHPDLHFAFPVNTTKTITKHPVSSHFLDRWREAINDNPYLNLNQWLELLEIENKQGLINVRESDEISNKLSLKPYEAEYKIMILWLPEKLHLAAANKLLKIVEEPPDNTIFLLVSENSEQIIPTILSRTQVVKIKKMSSDSIKKSLIENFEADPAHATDVAYLADGNYREALRLFDEQEKENFNGETFIKWMRICYGKEILQMIKWVEDVSAIGRERQKSFVKYGLNIFREALMKNYGNDSLVRTGNLENEFLNKFSPFVNEMNCLQLAEEFDVAYLHIERNTNPKILFLDLSLKVMKLLKAKKGVKSQ